MSFDPVGHWLVITALGLFILYLTMLLLLDREKPAIDFMKAIGFMPPENLPTEKSSTEKLFRISVTTQETPGSSVGVAPVGAGDVYGGSKSNFTMSMLTGVLEKTFEFFSRSKFNLSIRTSIDGCRPEDCELDIVEADVVLAGTPEFAETLAVIELFEKKRGELPEATNGVIKVGSVLCRDSDTKKADFLKNTLKSASDSFKSKMEEAHLNQQKRETSDITRITKPSNN